MPLDSAPVALWLRIPKNAGTSLHDALEAADLLAPGQPAAGRISGIGGDGAARFRSEYPGVWERALRFAIVRNPWDRVVSGWLYSRALRSQPLRDVLRNLPGPETRRDWHHLTRTQSEFLLDADGRLMPNRLLRFEQIETEWRILCEELNLPRLPLRHQNRTQRNRAHRAYYDMESRDLVAEIFRRDIELLGYEF